MRARARNSAKTAYEALRAYAPNLPELTTVFITHSHWDHVGGHKYFRALSPRLQFYARDNYGEEIARSAAAPGVFGKSFFGERFSIDDVLSFKPDLTIDRRTQLKSGEHASSSFPCREEKLTTQCWSTCRISALCSSVISLCLIWAHRSSRRATCKGCSIRSNRGAKEPPYLLHGHEPLTRNFASAAMLAQLKTDLSWLRDQVLGAMRRGDQRRANPPGKSDSPGLLNHQPECISRTSSCANTS